MDKNTIEYIIRFLTGDKHMPEIESSVGYTNEPDEFHKYKVIIRPSGFFTETGYGTSASLPTLPLQETDGIPILFGNSEIIHKEGKIFTHADIIASSYFLLSRYEEFVRKNERDVHGRFPGKESLPYRAGFLDRPLVDEYGRLLRKWLRTVGSDIPENPTGINKIWLTHDIDEPFFHRSFKGFIRGLISCRNRRSVIRNYFGKLSHNTAYTFPSFTEENKKLMQRTGRSRCESVFFFKAGGTGKQDRPVYNLGSKDIRTLFSFCKENEITTGLHASYTAGIMPSLISREKKTLEKAIGHTITFNRNHYLSSREPEDLVHLAESGIKDDFTMGYADVSGFRLGTCRPVSGINPENGKIYPVILHPLTIMECTLDRKEYMNLSYEKAFAYCKKLIENTAEHNGDIVLLWHNTSFIESPGNWQPALYRSLLNLLS